MKYWPKKLCKLFQNYHFQMHPTPQASYHRIHAAFYLQPIRSVYFRVAKMRPRTCAAPPKNLEGVKGFYFLYFTHTNVEWQSLYVCATKNTCAYIRRKLCTSGYKILTKCTFCDFTLWLPPASSPGPSARSQSLCTPLVTTYFKFHRCSKSMRTTRTVNAGFQSHCHAHIECQWSRKVRNPDYLKALWRNCDSNHMRMLIAGDRNYALERHWCS